MNWASDRERERADYIVLHTHTKYQARKYVRPEGKHLGHTFSVRAQYEARARCCCCCGCLLFGATALTLAFPTKHQHQHAPSYLNAAQQHRHSVPLLHSFGEHRTTERSERSILLDAGHFVSCVFLFRGPRIVVVDDVPRYMRGPRVCVCVHPCPQCIPRLSGGLRAIQCTPCTQFSGDFHNNSWFC